MLGDSENQFSFSVVAPASRRLSRGRPALASYLFLSVHRNNPRRSRRRYQRLLRQVDNIAPAFQLAFMAIAIGRCPESAHVDLAVTLRLFHHLLRSTPLF